MSDKPNLIHDAVLDSLRDELAEAWALADDLATAIAVWVDPEVKEGRRREHRAVTEALLARYREARGRCT